MASSVCNNGVSIRVGFGTKIGVFLKIARSSEFTLVRVTIITAFAEDQMVCELHVEVLAGEFQLLGDFVVAGAWVGVS